MLAILTWKHSLIAWYLQPSMEDNVIFRGSGKERDSEETCSSSCCTGKAPRGSQYIKSTGLQDHSLALAGGKKRASLISKFSGSTATPTATRRVLDSLLSWLWSFSKE